MKDQSCDQLEAKHYFYMGHALAEAHTALEHDEVPVGAVVVYDDIIIARGYNQKQSRQSPLAHAEMIAIADAAAYLRQWRLLDCIVYVTLEPCCMCAGAMSLARISQVVFALADGKSGACGSVFNIAEEKRLNHRLRVVSGIRAEESLQLLQTFFQKRRERRRGKLDGEVPERLNGTASKSVDPTGSEGSNPSLSANNVRECLPTRPE